jgi:hypothetical protein
MGGWPDQVYANKKKIEDGPLNQGQLMVQPLSDLHDVDSV